MAVFDEGLNMRRFASATDGRKTGDREWVGFFMPAPPPIARQCPPRSGEDKSPPHVTFLYVGELKPEQDQILIDTARRVFSDFPKTVRVDLGGLNYFYHHKKDRRVALARVSFDQEMAKLRVHLFSKLRKAGIHPQDSYILNYRPHMTLTYIDNMSERYDGKVPTGSWDVSGMEIWGMPKVHFVPFGMTPQERVAARYKDKKQVGGRVQYQYSDRQVALRHSEKAGKVEKLRKDIDKLLKDARKGLKSSDATEQAVAAAILLMADTYERVGNPESASQGHYGVTGLKVTHFSIEKGKPVLEYTGKCGVKQKKEITDKSLLNYLKAKAERDSEDTLIGYEKDGEWVAVDARQVNDYLKPYKVTAKDLRGYYANDVMRRSLLDIRKGGPELGDNRKEQLKKEFEQALKTTAEAVGHEEATLRKHYLVPGLEDAFLKSGDVPDKYKKATKTRTEKEDEEAARLVRPSPKKKPPRKDKRRNRVRVDDPDIDQGDRGDDPDLSRNYKKVGQDSPTFLWSPLYTQPPIGEDVLRGALGPPLDRQNLQRRLPMGTKRVPAPKKASQEGVRQLTEMMDRLASTFEHHYPSLQVSRRLAFDLAKRLDLMSALIEEQAGLVTAGSHGHGTGIMPSVPNQGFDPLEISKLEPGGALRSDPDEPYMRENFTEQETLELRTKQQAGNIQEAEKKMAAAAVQVLSSFLRLGEDEAAAKDAEDKKDEAKADAKAKAHDKKDEAKADDRKDEAKEEAPAPPKKEASDDEAKEEEEHDDDDEGEGKTARLAPGAFNIFV